MTFEKMHLLCKLFAQFVWNINKFAYLCIGLRKQAHKTDYSLLKLFIMMLERINTLSAEIGDHLFIRYNGAVRECVLRGYKIYDYDYNDAIIYFGKEIGEKAIHIFDYNFYYGIDNALKTDGEKVEILSYTIEEFHAKYFSQTSLFFDGHCFVGYLWQKADCEPGLYRTKEDISYAEVRENNDIRYFLKDGKRLSIASRWFSTKEACFEANKPKVIMLDE